MRALWRRLARAVVVAVMVVAVIAGSLAGSAPAGDGVVVGGIQPCAAIGGPGLPAYVAGTVTVLAGQVQRRPAGSSSSVAVLPTRVVETETVGQDSQYSFDLPPGNYVLRARYAQGPSAPQWNTVTVRAGETQRVDILNVCI